MSQGWSIAPQPAPVKGRGLIWSGAVLLVVSLVVGIVGVVGIGRGVGNLASGLTEPWATPGGVTASFESGRSYTVYELTGVGATATVQPSDVSVVGEGGFSVPVTGMGGMTQTFESGNDSFTAVAEFVAPTTGSYVVQVTTEGTTVAVGPALSEFVGVGLWGVAILVAILLGLLGLILLVVGLVLRSSSRRAAPAAGYAATAGSAATAYGAVPVDEQRDGIFEQPGPGQPGAVVSEPVQPAYQQPVAAQPVLPPAGWYPDPSRPGGQRYWDGGQWTEHQA